MKQRTRLGMLTPSSNTVLEPVTAAMLADLPDVTAHFARFKVTEIALSTSSLAQFDSGPIIAAAELLATARVDVIAWNGTSAAWLGFENDEALCAKIEAATGIGACTAVLAFREVFQRTKPHRIGIVTPYSADVQDRIIANWSASGLPCAAERHLDIQDNFAFAEVDEETIARMIHEVAGLGCDAVAVVCTNMRAAPMVAKLEERYGIPIYDSVAVTVWASLKAAGVSPGRVRGWGSLFSNPAALS